MRRLIGVAVLVLAGCGMDGVTGSDVIASDEPAATPAPVVVSDPVVLSPPEAGWRQSISAEGTLTHTNLSGDEQQMTLCAYRYRGAWMARAAAPVPAHGEASAVLYGRIPDDPADVMVYGLVGQDVDPAVGHPTGYGRACPSDQTKIPHALIGAKRRVSWTAPGWRP